MSQRADHAFPPDQPRYGGEMAAVMSALQLPAPSGVLALQDRYPWMGQGAFTFLPLAQHYLAAGNLAESQRLAYQFIRWALESKPELPPERRLRWWRRAWWWLR